MRRAAALAAVAVAVMAGCGGDDRGDRTEVPDLVGSSRREAAEALADAGLRWRFLGSPLVWAQRPPPSGSATADDDLVFDQEPDAGSLVEPRAIVVVDASCRRPEDPPDTICID